MLRGIGWDVRRVAEDSMAASVISLGRDAYPGPHTCAG
jgi:hypothetical protein